MTGSETNQDNLAVAQDFRCINFNAGPAAIPLEVLQQCQRELLNYRGTGASIMETSHRSTIFKELIAQVKSNYRTLLSIPDEYEIIFMPGGGMAQTSAILYNTLGRNMSEWAAYAVTGTWSKKAYEEADKLGYKRGLLCEPMQRRLPRAEEWFGNIGCGDYAEDCFTIPVEPPTLLHHCNNETISGMEYLHDPKELWKGKMPEKWLSKQVVWSMDASSNFCSKPINVANYDIIYAGAQKNVGTSGITVCIINKGRFGKGPSSEHCPSILNYKNYIDNDSCPNTIPNMPLYITGLVTDYLIKNGGLSAAEERASKRSKLLYNYIDHSDGYYSCPIEFGSRSRMNHVFRINKSDIENTSAPSLPHLQLEELFVKEAEKRHIIGIKGHRSVGGLRVSLYNSIKDKDVEDLIDFMTMFQEKYPKE